MHNLRFVFSGPLSGYLIEKFGERKVAIVGSLISAIGITSSAFVNSVPVLILTYGVISGKFVNILHMYIILPDTCSKILINSTEIQNNIS